ncbi:unnamed protein product [Dimorphilus gyrociliatus]|uniref:Uncharacterized protein n=1 Tax=Dimorphilus gyrociliatus TaxID=2664684 RepID=A0A7I8W230_9ANNE|nr:unnamed protein product [Dimorphilus gyrociliatus]
MPCWYYDRKDVRQNTPSRLNGIDSETETRYRREGARFILDTGNALGLPYDTCATATVYFHRFYMLRSFRQFDRHVMGATCILLAGKVEETPKKCKDVIHKAKKVLASTQYECLLGEDSREELMTLEQILLQTLKFDLSVKHPYSFLIKFAKLLKADKAKIEKMVQMCWTFINDSLCTTLSVQWEPEVIAVSLMYLACRLSKFTITDWAEKSSSGPKSKWWSALVPDMTMPLMEEICHQVLDLYMAKNKAEAPSPPPPPPPRNEQPQGTPIPSLVASRPHSVGPSSVTYPAPY